MLGKMYDHEENDPLSMCPYLCISHTLCSPFGGYFFTNDSPVKTIRVSALKINRASPVGAAKVNRL